MHHTALASFLNATLVSIPTFVHLFEMLIAPRTPVPRLVHQCQVDSHAIARWSVHPQSMVNTCVHSTRQRSTYGWIRKMRLRRGMHEVSISMQQSHVVQGVRVDDSQLDEIWRTINCAINLRPVHTGRGSGGAAAWSPRSLSSIVVHQESVPTRLPLAHVSTIL